MRLRLIGKLEKSFGIILLLYLILLFLTPGSGFVALLQVVLVLLGLWLLIRVARVGVRRAIWRLRNRLLMTYLFIAMVPILLIVVFVSIGTYALSSQLAVYLVSSELDRRIASLDWFGRAVAESSPQQRMQVLHGIGEVLRQRTSDPCIVLREGVSIVRWPENRPPCRARGLGRCEWHRRSRRPLLRMGARCPRRRRRHHHRSTQPRLFEQPDARAR